MDEKFEKDEQKLFFNSPGTKKTILVVEGVNVPTLIVEGAPGAFTHFLTVSTLISPQH